MNKEHDSLFLKFEQLARLLKVICDGVPIQSPELLLQVGEARLLLLTLRKQVLK